MRKNKVFIALLIFIILIGGITIAKSYDDSSFNSLKEFFISKLSLEQKSELEDFSDLTFYDKLQIIKQNQRALDGE